MHHRRHLPHSAPVDPKLNRPVFCIRSGWVSGLCFGSWPSGVIASNSAVANDRFVDELHNYAAASPATAVATLENNRRMQSPFSGL